MTNMSPYSKATRKMQAAEVLLLLLAIAAHQIGSRARSLTIQEQQQHMDPVKYERGDCLYETVVCLRDDSCGPLLRLVYAYCYETPGYQEERPDGSLLLCDSSCAALLSVLFNTSAGVRLRECNYNSYPFWTDLVIQKQFMCTTLLPKTDQLLQRALAGTVRVECWLAGLLCARDFSCRSTLMGILDMPCYDGPCSPECASRMGAFGSMFRNVFHTFLSCLCGQELVAACPTLPSGYLSNRSTALDGIAFAAPLDRLMEQLGREAIREQMSDSIWLLKVFEHRSYCRSLKAIVNEPNCVKPSQHIQRPVVNEPLCTLESVYHWPTTTAPSTIASISSPISTSKSSTTLQKQSSQSESSKLGQLQTLWQQPTAGPKAVDDDTMAVTGACQQLASVTTMPVLLLFSIFVYLFTYLMLH